MKWLKASDESESKNVREETKDDEEFELEVEKPDNEPNDEVVEDNDENEEETEENQEEETRVNTPVTRPKLSRELRGLESYNRPGRLEIEGNNNFCFFTPNTSEEIDDDTPTNFQEAWYHKDPVKREKWREAIRLEFRQMIKNGVWRNRGQNNIPRNRKGIGTKWVFKEKKNGVFRARLVVKGYDQIAGVDFQYNFAPVTSEITLRILLIMWIIEDYFAEIADVQTAFLYGELEEELFIHIPSGYEEYLSEIGEQVEGNYLKLEKSTYGLVQAARSWWKKFTTVLKSELQFTQFQNDSCLLKKEDEDGKVFLIVYVDDCFLLGDKVAVKKALNDIQKFFSITRSELIEDFIGCRIEKQEDRILLSQPDLIKKMLKLFETKIKNLREYETPAPSNTHIIRCKTEEENNKEFYLFRQGVTSICRRPNPARALGQGAES